jgi:hypothetical protein
MRWQSCNDVSCFFHILVHGPIILEQHSRSHHSLHYGAFWQESDPLNSYNIYKSYGENKTQLQFSKQLVKDLTVLVNEGDSEVCGVVTKEFRDLNVWT